MREISLKSKYTIKFVMISANFILLLLLLLTKTHKSLSQMLLYEVQANIHMPFIDYLCVELFKKVSADLCS